MRRLKARANGLVIAPHPFFPALSCLRGLLDRHADLFDAVEINAFYTPAIDFNARARRWAAACGKPLVGNCDVHRLAQLGATYSLIDAAPEPDAVCDAIRAGRVAVESRPITMLDAARHMSSMCAADVIGPFFRPRSRPVPRIGAPTVS